MIFLHKKQCVRERPNFTNQVNNYNNIIITEVMYCLYEKC